MRYFIVIWSCCIHFVNDFLDQGLFLSRVYGHCVGTKSKSAYNISRVGQWNTGIKNRPACSPPVTSIGFKGRTARDWATYNNYLGTRFALSAVTGAMDPKTWLTGKRGGNQRMYTDQIIMVLAKLKALLNLAVTWGVWDAGRLC